MEYFCAEHKAHEFETPGIDFLVPIRSKQGIRSSQLFSKSKNTSTSFVLKNIFGFVIDRISSSFFVVLLQFANMILFNMICLKTAFFAFVLINIFSTKTLKTPIISGSLTGFIFSRETFFRYT